MTNCGHDVSLKLTLQECEISSFQQTGLESGPDLFKTKVKPSVMFQYGIFNVIRAVCDSILPIQNTCS